MPKEAKPPSPRGRINTPILKQGEALCQRCQKKPPSPKNDGYCWVCGPVVRAEKAKYVICPKCSKEWSFLAESGVCADCDTKADDAKIERHRRLASLAFILGGQEAVKKYTFDNLSRVEAGQNDDGPFCGNSTAFDFMREFTPRYRSAYLWGPPGGGKSHLGMATVAKCHMEGYRVAVFSPRELVNCFKTKDSREEAAAMTRCVALDLIMINDMGISKITGWAMELICEIFDRRVYQGKKGIIITSNLFVDDLGRKYDDDRLPSRVVEHSTFLEVNPGQDFRVPQ